MATFVKNLNTNGEFVEGVLHAPRYDLRWVFDFVNKPTRRGIWSNPGNETDSAGRVNKNDLLRATIEARNYYTEETAIVAECTGEDFVNFKWKASRHQLMSGSNLHMLANYHSLDGLTLVCRSVEVHVLFSGEHLVTERTEEDKNFHYECFGR